MIPTSRKEVTDMALLDLQGMETPAGHHGASRFSRGCHGGGGGTSTLSLLLC